MQTAHILYRLQAFRQHRGGFRLHREELRQVVYLFVAAAKLIENVGKEMRKTIVILSLLSVMYGCEVRPVVKVPIAPSAMNKTTYEVGKNYKVSTGDSILRVGKVQQYKYPIFSPSMVYEPAQVEDLTMPQLIPNQTWIARYITYEDNGVVVVNPTYSEEILKKNKPVKILGLEVITKVSEENNWGIHLIPDKDNQWKVGRGWVGINTEIKRQFSWKKEIRFQKIGERLETGPEGALIAELIYSGVSENMVHFLYREFIDDIARPSFFQELVYDLNKSKQVAFKSIILEVVEATNLALTFKVIEDGGLQWLPYLSPSIERLFQLFP